MATGDGFPLRQGAGTGSRLVFGGYKGLRWRKSQSRLSSGSLGIYRRGWRREQVKVPHEELFWTILGFIIHFYIIFGTNLLTGGPAQICYFMPISVFRGKGISDGVKTERNQLDKLFLEGNPPDGLGPHVRRATRRSRGRGRAPQPRGQPETLVVHLRYSVGFFWSKNKFREVLGQLDSVWFSFPSKP